MAGKLRSTEIQITSVFLSGDPVWENAQTWVLPDTSIELSIPAHPETLYAVRTRTQDVYGNFAEWSTHTEYTTIAGKDSTAAAIADAVIPLAITAAMIQANAITADKLAATIILGSLIATGEPGTRRVELDITGITLFDASNVPVVRIPTNGDPVFVKGQITASTLIAEESAEFQTLASLASAAVFTLEAGVANPSAPPVVAASLDSLGLDAPPSTGYGVCFDTAGGAGGTTDVYWVGADPETTDDVAYEYDASTGALLRTITTTNTLVSHTATGGSTTHYDDSAQAEAGSTDDQVAIRIAIPDQGGDSSNYKVTKIAAYLAGYSGSATCYMCIWNGTTETIMGLSAAFTATSRTFANGNSDLYNKSLSSPEAVTAGDTYYFGFARTAGDFQWDRRDSVGTTYIGDNDNGSLTSLTTDASHKANVYFTYTYDTGSLLEGTIGTIIGVAADTTHLYALDDLGTIFKYLKSDLSYVGKVAATANISGTDAKAGLFYDGTNLVITTTTGTGTTRVKFVKYTTALAYASADVQDDSGPTFSGTTDTIRGGYYDATNYWVSVSGVVYCYTASNGENVANRHFGSSASASAGVTWDPVNSIFRGYATASPTQLWKFTDWDWTTESDVYWFCYAWYDSDATGGTHTSGIGPRVSVTLRRRERVQVTNATIPDAGGTDDPNGVKVYAVRNATELAATNYKLQATDALTTRYVSTYVTATADAASDFPGGATSQMKSATAGWSLYGDGTGTLGLLVTGGKPPIRRVYTTANDGTGAWTVPTGLKYIEVEVVGGGGAGAGVADPAAGNTTIGGGGGGGGYAKKLFTAADLAGDTAFDVTIAAAAAGDADGGATGGTCSFAGTGITTVQATGGTGGVTLATGTSLIGRGGSPGGIGSGGDINIGGDTGKTGVRLSATQGFGGQGGMSGGGMGGGGMSAHNISSGVATDGSNGQPYGGGGGGASSLDGGDGTTATGGDGAEGVVIVTEYYS